jgi:hypothetical protein
MYVELLDLSLLRMIIFVYLQREDKIIVLQVSLHCNETSLIKTSFKAINRKNHTDVWIKLLNEVFLSRQD